VQCPQAAQVSVYTLQGQKISSFAMSDGIHTMAAPAQAGIYVVTIETNDGSTTCRLSIQ